MEELTSGVAETTLAISGADPAVANERKVLRSSEASSRPGVESPRGLDVNVDGILELGAAV